MVNIIIHGAGGAMGRAVADLALRSPEEFAVVAGVDKFPPAPNSFPFPIYSSLEECTEPADVIIDFSMPDALPGLIAAALKRRCGLVIATTGHSEKDMEAIRKAGESIPVFKTANMSLGVNLQMELTRKAASFFGEGFDIEIIEKHHNRKVDAPSGTALALAQALSDEFKDGKDFVYERHSVRQKRSQREIGIHAVRGGTIVGEHEVLFIGEDEIFSVEHRALSRRVFAVGALRAAAYIRAKKEPGLYSMKEIVADQQTPTMSVEEHQAIITLGSLNIADAKVLQFFDAAAREGIAIDMISQTASSENFSHLSFALAEKNLAKALLLLEECGCQEISSCSGMVKICLQSTGITAKFFSALQSAGVQARLTAASQFGISCCVDEKDLAAVREALTNAAVL